ncbi:hypothetical protein [Qipengyuania flava]|uniref:hypothetical protein n=1 Tax=Qipengyuania flava TaxID=192812 RepID=UPI001C62F2D6|nr:hypothetical protein [Qipengyuania flava]QYJ07729.1 hypothetical protein KUV82_03135 [Qipengyuania flava]
MPIAIEESATVPVSSMISCRKSACDGQAKRPEKCPRRHARTTAPCAAMQGRPDTNQNVRIPHTMQYAIAASVWAHVVLGALAVLAGAAALAMRKGSPNHIKSGQLFAIAMGLSSLLGAILGLVRFEDLYITFHGGVLGVTLIASGVLTLRTKGAGLTGWALVVAAINGFNFLALLLAGSYASGMPEGRLAGFHAADYFFLAGMAGFAAAGDLRMAVRRTYPYKHRIARHLWRMCLGFFIAAGSAFTGPGASAFPVAWQESGLLSLPELIIFVLMLYWLARTLMGKRTQASGEPS